MAKVLGPGMSIGAKGKIGNSIIFNEKKGINTSKEYIIPKDQKSSGQITQRSYMAEAVNDWKTDSYSVIDIAAWNFYAKIYKKTASGMNYFLKERINILKISDDWTILKNCVVSSITGEGCIVTVDVASDKSGILYCGISKYSMLTEFIGVFDTDHYTFTITGLENSTQYYFYIKNTSINEGSRTGIYKVKTTAYTPPAPVQIIMGLPAIDRNGALGNYTLVNRVAAANKTGKITSVEVFTKSASIVARIGIFYLVSGNNLTTRAVYDPGIVNWPANSKTIVPVDLDVVEGDFIGVWANGQIRVSTSGEAGVWFKAGLFMPCTDLTFGIFGAWGASVKGIGLSS